MAYKRKRITAYGGGGKRARNMKYRGSTAMVVYRARPRQRSGLSTAIKRVLNGRTGGYVGLEKKFFDVSRSSAISVATDASGGEVDPVAINCLNAPAQGDGESQRDGRQISMDSLTVKGTITINPQAGQTNLDPMPDIFIAIVLDKQTNAAQLNSEDVFENPAGDNRLNAQPFRNLEWTKRFRVLKTMRVTAGDFASGVIPVNNNAVNDFNSTGVTVPFSCHIPLRGMLVNFVSGITSTTVTAIADNSLHVIAYQTSNAYGATIAYTSRLRFRG